MNALVVARSENASVAAQKFESSVGDTQVSGLVADEFSAVAEVFVDNFKQRGELGAALCIRQNGRTVVDLWGGFADPARHRPWQADTLGVVFSCTKAAAALCVHDLAAQGRLQLDQPLAQYWPEYAAHGKEGTTIRMVLEHTAGVPVLRQPIRPDGLEDFDYMVQQLEQARPLWSPGSQKGYHPLTYGYLLGEVVRRVTGQSIGTYLRQQVMAGTDIDFWIGLPESEEARVATMVPYKGTGASATFQSLAAQPGSLQNLFIFNSGTWSYRGLNTRAGHAAEIPAANGIASARGLAGLYDLCVGVPAPHTSNLRAAIERLHNGFSAAPATDDLTLLIPTRFHAGFMLSMDNPPGVDSMRLGPNAFGHCGMGGSLGFADPVHGLSFGYVMNALGSGVLLNQRGQSLADACYAALSSR